MIFFIIAYLYAIELSLGVDCWVPGIDTIMFDIISDSTIEMVDSNNNYLKNAIVCTNIWSKSPRIQGVGYVCDNDNTLSVGTHYFRATFNIIGIPVEGTLMLACDDYAKATINGNSELCNWADVVTLATCNVLQYLKSGFNTAVFICDNIGSGGGITFKLSVASQI